MEEIKLINKEILQNDFFHDFIAFLKYLEQKPIKRTTTGNISLADISALQKQFRQQELFNQFKRYNWRIHSERMVEFLSQIKIIAVAMHLTYNRKGRLYLSKNGKGYLQNIEKDTQYWHMVLNYWQRVNWEYFSPSPELDGNSVMTTIQQNQPVIWEALLRKGGEWIDFQTFCQTLETLFKLDRYYKDLDSYNYQIDIEYGLFKKNLCRFGCVELKEVRDKYNFKRIGQFRPTALGLFVFQKGITTAI